MHLTSSMVRGDYLFSQLRGSTVIDMSLIFSFSLAHLRLTIETRFLVWQFTKNKRFPAKLVAIKNGKSNLLKHGKCQTLQQSRSGLMSCHSISLNCIFASKAKYLVFPFFYIAAHIMSSFKTNMYAIVNPTFSVSIFWILKAFPFLATIFPSVSSKSKIYGNSPKQICHGLKYM